MKGFLAPLPTVREKFGPLSGSSHASCRPCTAQLRAGLRVHVRLAGSGRDGSQRHGRKNSSFFSFCRIFKQHSLQILKVQEALVHICFVMISALQQSEGDVAVPTFPSFAASPKERCLGKRMFGALQRHCFWDLDNAG